MPERPPVVVYPPLGTGGRRVTARGQLLGLAYSDQDLEFLRGAGLPGVEDLLDDLAWVKWVGNNAHHYTSG
ncbi:hypothetical protein ABZV31_11905 [Streptomyces sp. NPDC005202]|uniref:hypothetical protein n=1 Tax=Streptomyces sp. NPDC005202 TaxID=3157021 RepID=UPI0033B849E0